MNDLMPVAPGTGALPLSLELPMMSVPLRLLVGDARDNRAPASCGADLRAEAAAVLVSYSAACRPVPPQTVSSWLHTINYASSAPVTRGEFTARADAIAEVLCNLPVGLLHARRGMTSRPNTGFSLGRRISSRLWPGGRTTCNSPPALCESSPGCPTRSAPRLNRLNRLRPNETRVWRGFAPLSRRACPTSGPASSHRLTVTMRQLEMSETDETRWSRADETPSVRADLFADAPDHDVRRIQGVFGLPLGIIVFLILVWRVLAALPKG